MFLGVLVNRETKQNGETKQKPTNLHVIRAQAAHSTRQYFQCFLLCYGSPPASAALVR